MKKAGCVDDVHISLQFRPQLFIGVKDIRADARELQPSPVLKQILRDTEEAWFEIDRRTITGGCSIIRKLADILGEAAPQVHEFGVLREARKDVRIERMLREGADEEAKETDTWIRTYCVGSALLSGDHRRMIH